MFAVRLGPNADVAVVERRLARLTSYYSPLGQPKASFRSVGRLSLVYGAIDFDGGPVAIDAPVVWGAALPAEMATAGPLLAAEETTLRKLDTVTAAIAATQDQAVIVTGASGATSLYFAASPAAQAWSTHAVAAAYLAEGMASIDEEAIPELIAAGFVGGQRTLVRGVEAVEPAMRIGITAEGVQRASYWSREERWARMPEESAHELAESSLLSALKRHVGRKPVYCGMTAGRDSRVMALALDELGIDYTGFTVGAPGDPDVEGAKHVAEELGATHRTYEPEPRTADHVDRHVEAQARWGDGMAPILFGGRFTTEHAAGTVVTGGGGETGRCFYYRWIARNYREPSPAQLRRIFRLDAAIAMATDDARELLRRSVDRWLRDAEQLGYSGWRCLDVVYSEQRVRRISRANVLPGNAEVVLGFHTPDTQRALAGMALEERLTDGFHRRFIRERFPSLEPPAPPVQRPGVPAPLRRAVAAVRSRTGSDGGGTPTEYSPPAHGAELEWVTDTVLDSPILRAPLGQAWLTDTRTRFAQGDPRTVTAVLRAAGPVALAASLQGLSAG